MRHPPHLRSAFVCAAVATALVAGVSACGGNSTGSTAGGTLTIQGDTGSPSLVENFNPFTSATELHGTYLIYAPLEIPSPVDGSYTPFLATGFSFTNPTTLVYTIRRGVKWSDGKPFTPADVVFTFNLLKKYPALDGNGVWSQISGNLRTSPG
jgi:peptide/nickel transport system substrate-binding protein